MDRLFVELAQRRRPEQSWKEGKDGCRILTFAFLVGHRLACSILAQGGDGGGGGEAALWRRLLHIFKKLTKLAK